MVSRFAKGSETSKKGNVNGNIALSWCKSKQYLHQAFSDASYQKRSSFWRGPGAFLTI